MQRRIRIIMDEKRKIYPDLKTNYIVGSWDGDMENAVSNAIRFNRELFVIRPEGFDLEVKDL